MAGAPHSAHARLPTIRTRILAAFVLSLLAFTGALGYSLVQLRHIGRGLVTIDTGYLPLAGHAARIEVVARQLDREHDRFAREDLRPLAGHRSNTTFYTSTLADAVDAGRVTAAAARSQATEPGEREALAHVLELLDDLDALRIGYNDAFVAWADTRAEGAAGTPGELPGELPGALPDEAGVAPADARALADLDQRRTQLILKAGEFGSLIEARIQAVSNRTSRAQTRAWTVGGALTALAVVLAGVLAAVALVTLRPIGLLTQQVQRLAAGERAGPVDVRARDEVGLLAREFNAMAAAVAERDRRLVDRAEALDRLSLRLRQVLDTIHAGLIVSVEGKVEMSNPAAGALWSATVGATVPGPLATLEPGRHRSLALGQRLFDVDVVAFGPGGQLIVGEDVTERIRDRERLARSERLALVGQMLAQITHEVRNPLNAMSLHAELLADDVHDPEQRSMLETITGEIRRLEVLTARYLELARGRRPERTPTDAGQMVREVLRLDEEALRRTGVELVLHDHAGGEVVDIDADALRRALRNVVRNAAEAGARSVSVTASIVPAGGGAAGSAARAVRLTVRDDGPGLAEPERVFEPFFTTKARGTGLGLAISRQELEDVGGTICCESAPGEGSVFELTVPIEEDA